MSGKDSNRKRNRTVSFRLSERELKDLNIRIEAGGIKKTKYYIDACLYGRVIVVGSRENIDLLINELYEMELLFKMLLEELTAGNTDELDEKIQQVREDYVAMVKAIYEIAREGNASI